MFDLSDDDYVPVDGPSCYSDPGWFEITFGILITLGIYISWLPQVAHLLLE